MNEFLQSLRADLLSRRMLPLLAVAVIGLAVAVGFALASSGASTPPRAAGTSTVGSRPASLALAAASPNPNAAEAETPGGVRYQTQGPLHDPFAPLPSSEAKQANAGSSSASTAKSVATSGSPGSGAGPSGSGSGSGAGGSGSGNGGEPSPPPTPAKKPGKHRQKPSFPYDVSILFGQLPAGGQPVTLPPYQNLQPQQPIPSAQDARIALERVGGNGKSAVFELLAPPILRGQGVCLPTPSECQQLALDAGQAEELEYLEADGQSVVYELKAVSIVKRSAQTAG